MVYNPVKTRCWLCGNDNALCSEEDHGNRLFYQCNSIECGDYIISKHFAKTQTHSELREILSALAKKYKGTDKIPVGFYKTIDNIVIEIEDK